MKTGRKSMEKPNGEPTENRLADKNRRRSYLIGAAILAVFAVHFAWQFSFVQKENLRIAEDSMKIAPPEIMSVENQPSEKNVKTNTDSAAKQMKVEQTKTVLPAKFSPPENKRPSLETKKTPVESKSSRLRRAEKLLTGF